MNTKFILSLCVFVLAASVCSAQDSTVQSDTTMKADTTDATSDMAKTDMAKTDTATETGDVTSPSDSGMEASMGTTGNNPVTGTVESITNPDLTTMSTTPAVQDPITTTSGASVSLVTTLALLLPMIAGVFAQYL